MIDFKVGDKVVLVDAKDRFFPSSNIKGVTLGNTYTVLEIGPRFLYINRDDGRRSGYYPERFKKEEEVSVNPFEAEAREKKAVLLARAVNSFYGHYVANSAPLPQWARNNALRNTGKDHASEETWEIVEGKLKRYHTYSVPFDAPGVDVPADVALDNAAVAKELRSIIDLPIGVSIAVRARLRKLADQLDPPSVTVEMTEEQRRILASYVATGFISPGDRKKISSVL